MQVVNGLAAVLAAVHYQTEPIFGNSQLFGHLNGLFGQEGNDGIPRRGVFHRLQVAFGNEKDMNRRLGMDVVKGQHLVVLIGDPNGDFLTDEFAKKAILAHFFSSWFL